MDKEDKMVLQELILNLTSYKPKLHFLSVTWRPPEAHQVKCNTYGACRGNPGKSSYGFYIRDSRGYLIYAKAKGLGLATNQEVEAMAILSALRECLKRRLQDVIIETDSLSLKKIILKSWRIPWELIEIVEEIREIIQKTRATITHIYREGNCLANIAIDSQMDHEYHNWHELPLMERRILNSDKARLPTRGLEHGELIHNDSHYESKRRRQDTSAAKQENKDNLEDKYSTKGLRRLLFHVIYINVHQFLEEVAHIYPEERRTTQEKKSQRKENKKKKFIPGNPS
ncbi:hypothetical protein KY290_007993 [Solanum tuberosum]|uniref:RNase H type-1 domain-containing protein n=1 Tax=Solanum tuberosum TaxID=4113 RepID=A0ABQ7W9U6_SOLTU|nr:hypothetical protein KY290_007993 [Solanum tuberosum]